MPINFLSLKRTERALLAVLTLVCLLLSSAASGGIASAAPPDGARVTESASCKDFSGQPKDACSFGYNTSIGSRAAKHVTPDKDYNSDESADAKDACTKYKNDANNKACIQGYKDGHYAYYHKTDHNPAVTTPTKTTKPGATYCDQSSANCSDPAADPNAKCDNDDCDFIKKFVNPAINTLSACFGVIAIISIILGGINYATSEGDPQKTSRAKNRIFNTIIAVIAYIFLYAFLQFLVPGGAFK